MFCCDVGRVTGDVADGGSVCVCLVECIDEGARGV